MKKFEGTLPAVTTPAPAITCSVASGTGYSAKSELPVGSASFPCDASGYTGTISYTCPSSGGTISGTGSCTAITCNVPSTVNANESSVGFSTTPTTTGLTCKTGFTGSPTYTCTGITSTGTYTAGGTACTAITSCLYTETNAGESQCLLTANATITFALNTSGVMLCPYGSGGTSRTTPPQRDMKYKCNADGTLQTETRARCSFLNATYGYFHIAFSSKYDSPNCIPGGSLYGTTSCNTCSYANGRTSLTDSKCVLITVSTYGGCYTTPPNLWSF